MIMVGNILKSIIEIPNIPKGTQFEVTSVTSDGTIIVKNEYGTGCLSIDEIGKMFEVVAVKPKREWTEWRLSEYLKSGLLYMWKTNGKCVRVSIGGISASASCHPDDVFDLDKGTKLALARCFYKLGDGVYEGIAKTLWS